MNPIQTHFLPIDEVIPAAQQSLSRKVKQAKSPILILLSGGSAIGSYPVLEELIAAGHGQNLHIGLIDERYGPEGHVDSNALAIECQSRLRSVAKAQGIDFQTMLTGRTVDEEVKVYSAWLKQMLIICRSKIGILGVGLDGHLAGIKPRKNKSDFQNLFDNGRETVTYYDSPDFGQRITVTLPLLRLLDEVLVVAPGNGKRAVIEQALKSADQPINLMPARILPQLQKVEVFASA